MSDDAPITLTEAGYGNLLLAAEKRLGAIEDGYPQELWRLGLIEKDRDDHDHLTGFFRLTEPGWQVYRFAKLDRMLPRIGASYALPGINDALMETAAILRDVDSRLTTIEARVKATNERLDELMNTLRGI